jgi:two-component system, NtrC family, nitrogen regulation response regulator NtrX
MYILIVEDEPPVASNLAELLENEGHQTGIAHNLADAHTQMGERIPDVVFLDIYLPDGSGLELMTAYKEAEFVIITGTPREQTVNEALAKGASAYLAKPFLLDDVLDALARVAKG